MLQNIIGQRGKKYNDFQGKRLGLLVNDYEEGETLADFLDDPQSQPGVHGFEDVDLSKEPEDYQTTPGPTRLIRSKADLLSPQKDISEYDDVVNQFKFYSAGEAPEKPERNKKVDRLMRFAQFANVLAQGVNAASGGFASGVDITGKYWDKIAGMDEDYATQLREHNNKLFQADRLNKDLHNRGVLQGRQNEADLIDAEEAFGRQKDLTQMRIDAESEALDKKINADRKAANDSNSNEQARQNNYLAQNILNQIKRLQEDRDSVDMPDYSATKAEKAKAIAKRNQYQEDINTLNDQLFELNGTRVEVRPNTQLVVKGEDGNLYDFTGAPVEKKSQSDSSKTKTNPVEARNVLNDIDKALQSGSMSKEDAIPQIAQILIREKGLSKDAAFSAAREAVGE